MSIRNRDHGGITWHWEVPEGETHEDSSGGTGIEDWEGEHEMLAISAPSEGAARAEMVWTEVMEGMRSDFFWLVDSFGMKSHAEGT